MKKLNLEKKLYRLLYRYFTYCKNFFFFWGQGVWVSFLLILGLAISKGILILENGQEEKGEIL
jgi:hypothetical protein